MAVRFKRVAVAFNEAALVRVCESSGSEHYSPEDSNHLSDLVNSFIERDYYTDINQAGEDLENDDSSKLEELASNSWSDSADDNKNALLDFLNNHDGNDDVRRTIRAETLLACGIIGDSSSHGFKRRLMSHLLDRGFDAGLCKSRWEKFGRHPPGEYEYVDVNVGGDRFIVEVFIAAEFEIARPSAAYTALLDVFPQVLVAKPEELKQIVKLVCSAMSRSMKEMDLHVPPWRRNWYMQAKWFGPYKRTINRIPARKKPQSDQYFAAKRFNIGFEAFPLKPYYHCRDDSAFVTENGSKIGYLTAAFNNSVDTQ